MVDSSSDSMLIDSSKSIFPFDIRVESIEDILAKKIVFRKYNIAIELVEPINEYITLAKMAPNFIIEHIKMLLVNSQ